MKQQINLFRNHGQILNFLQEDRIRDFRDEGRVEMIRDKSHTIMGFSYSRLDEEVDNEIQMFRKYLKEDENSNSDLIMFENQVWGLEEADLITPGQNSFDTGEDTKQQTGLPGGSLAEAANNPNVNRIIAHKVKRYSVSQLEYILNNPEKLKQTFNGLVEEEGIPKTTENFEKTKEIINNFIQWYSKGNTSSLNEDTEQYEFNPLYGAGETADEDIESIDNRISHSKAKPMKIKENEEHTDDSSSFVPTSSYGGNMSSFAEAEEIEESNITMFDGNGTDTNEDAGLVGSLNEKLKKFLHGFKI